jgi:transposase
MTSIADVYDVVVGVDTHLDTNTAAVMDRLGAVHAQATAGTDPAGLAELLAFADAHTPAGARRLWAIDGTRAHGQGLTRLLQAGGENVAEAPKPAPAARRRGGKSDALDAVAAGRAVLAQPVEGIATPRADGPREALRMLLARRRHHSDTRTATVNLVKSVILTADNELRGALRGRSTTAQIRHLTQLPAEPDLPVDQHTRRQLLTSLAHQIRTPDRQLTDNHRQLRALVTQLCPPLLQQPGVGPVTAAVALTTWSHPGRVRSEAAYAALAGATPIPVASGRTDRHRLNRGGDRTLNAALHTIVLTRRRIDPATRAYVTRRRAQGRTNREITRCLKRYIARQLHHTMTAHHRTT